MTGKQSKFKYTRKTLDKSREQSFPFKSLLSQEDKATCRGHDLSACERLHRDVLQDLGESSGPGSSQVVPGGIEGVKPLGYGDGLCIYISLLETKIQNLIKVGGRKGFPKKALKLCVELWVALERGGR